MLPQPFSNDKDASITPDTVQHPYYTESFLIPKLNFLCYFCSSDLFWDLNYMN